MVTWGTCGIGARSWSTGLSSSPRSWRIPRSGAYVERPVTAHGTRLRVGTEGIRAVNPRPRSPLPILVHEQVVLVRCRSSVDGSRYRVQPAHRQLDLVRPLWLRGRNYRSDSHQPLSSS